MKLQYYKQTIFFLFSISILLTLNSCEQVKDIEYDLPFEGEKTVLYGFLSDVDSSIIQVYNSQAVSIDNPDFTVENAEVNIFEDGNLIQNLNFQNNKPVLKYFYPHNTESNYSIEVRRDDELSQSETFQLSPSIGIDSLTYVTSEDETAVDISFYFMDTEESNYYSYSVEKYFEGERVLEREGSDLDERFLGVFSDEDFKNLSKEIVLLDEDLQVFRLDENFNFIGVVDIDSLVVNLFTLSEEFFLRRKSELDNDEGDIGRANSPNEAVWSNVNNGYGFVGGVSKRTFSITF